MITATLRLVKSAASAQIASGSQLLRIPRGSLGYLAARLVSRDVDQGNRVALLVISSARIIGHLFPVGASRVAFDCPLSMQHAATRGLVKRGAIIAVVDYPLSLPSRRRCSAFQIDGLAGDGRLNLVSGQICSDHRPDDSN